MRNAAADLFTGCTDHRSRCRRIARIVREVPKSEAREIIDALLESNDSASKLLGAALSLYFLLPRESAGQLCGAIQQGGLKLACKLRVESTWKSARTGLVGAAALRAVDILLLHFRSSSRVASRAAILLAVRIAASEDELRDVHTEGHTLQPPLARLTYFKQVC